MYCYIWSTEYNARNLSVHFMAFFHFFHFRILAYWDHYPKFEGFGSLRLLKKYYPSHSK